jgi:hypothetical protein
MHRPPNRMMNFPYGSATNLPELDFILNKLYNFAVVNCTKLFHQNRGRSPSLAVGTEQSLRCRAVPAEQEWFLFVRVPGFFERQTCGVNVQHYKEQQPYGNWYSEVVQ